MDEAREFIAVFRELNATSDRCIIRFTPSLIGLFGTPRLFEFFLDELDAALCNKTIDPPLHERARNLAQIFIPQVAGYNNVSEPAAVTVTPEQLRNIRIDTPEHRKLGVQIILASLMQILVEINTLD